MPFAPRETRFTGPPHGRGTIEMTHTLDDACPALRERCPIDLAILSRWFLEHGSEPRQADEADAAADAPRAEEVAA